MSFHRSVTFVWVVSVIGLTSLLCAEQRLPEGFSTDSRGNVVNTRPGNTLPHSMIISFKETSLAGYVAAELFQKKQSFNTIETTSALDALLQRHKVTRMTSISEPGNPARAVSPLTHRDAQRVVESKHEKLRARVQQRRATHASMASSLKQPRPCNAYMLTLDAGANVDEACREFGAAQELLYAEPVFTVRTCHVPNDPYYSSTGTWEAGLPDMWGLKLLNLQNTWDSYTGAGVVVAVVDTGVDYNHEDIAANIWHNTDEIPNNFIDDDGNGYTDDSIGYNYVSGTGDPLDDGGHGTHVAGTIAATGDNNLGIVGVAYGATIMPLKALDRDGQGYSGPLSMAIHYAADNGADVINCSFAGYGYSETFQEAVDYALAMGCKVIVGAGNDSMDARYVMPANCEGVITVGAIGVYASSFPTFAHITSYSNFGPKVDFYAPGGGNASEVLSLLAAGSKYAQTMTYNIVGGNYLHLQGTSMATPHVSGLAALLVQKFPGLTQEQLRYALRSSSKSLSAGNSYVADYNARLVDGEAGVNLTSGPLPNMNPYISSPHMRFAWPENFILKKGLVTLKGTAGGDGFTSYSIEYKPRAAGNYSFLQQSFAPVTDGVLATLDTSSWADGEYYIKLRCFDALGLGTECRTSIHVDSTVKPNWPRFACSYWKSLPPTWRSRDTEDDCVTFADLDNDGIKEVIAVGEQDLYVFRIDGTPYNGVFPMHRYEINKWSSAPAIADLNNDGYPEIILQADVPGQSHPIYVFNRYGNPVPGFPAGNPDPAIPALVEHINGYFSPAVTDINGDGNKEIVFSIGTWNSNYPRLYLHALNRSGGAVPGFPVTVSNDYAPVTENSVSDLDGDGNKEICLGRESDWQSANLTLSMYSSAGTLLRDKVIPSEGTGLQPLEEQLTAGDWSNTGHRQITAVTNDVNLHLLNSDGTYAPGWPVRNPQYEDFSNKHVLTDVDQDGKLELVYFSGWYSTALSARRHDGTYVPGYPTASLEGYVLLGVSGSHLISGCTSLTSGPSLFLGEHDHGFQGRDAIGTKLTGWPKQILGSQGAPAIADLDLNGRPEIGLKNYEGMVYLWEDPGTVPATRISQWPTEKGNNQRTGEPNIPRVQILGLDDPCYSGTSASVDLRWEHLPEDELYKVDLELINTDTGGIVEASLQIESFDVENTTHTSFLVDSDAPLGVHYKLSARCVVRATGVPVAADETPATVVVYDSATTVPAVANVAYAQRSDGAGGSQVVVTYDLASRSANCNVAISISDDGGSTFDILPGSLSGHAGAAVARGAERTVIWDVDADLTETTIDNAVVRVTATDEALASTGYGDSASGVIETVRPRVSGITCPTPSSIDLVFTEPVDSSVAGVAGNYTASGTGCGSLGPHPNSVTGGPATFTLTWSEGRQVLGQPLTVTVSGVVQDSVGNPLPINGIDNVGSGTGVPVTLGAFSVE